MSNFFKRWSALKTSQTQIAEQKPEDNPIQTEPSQEIKPPTDNPEIVQGPTLEDVAKLQADSDFSLFVNQDVTDDVHHAAMKKLFSDPHYNIMDGLDIYIDDYSKEDPLPPGMLEKMVQSSMLGLFNKVVEKKGQESPEQLNPAPTLSAEIDTISSDNPTPQESPADIKITNLSKDPLDDPNAPL
jgi:Protein of unknown function (DUF3306)